MSAKDDVEQLPGMLAEGRFMLQQIAQALLEGDLRLLGLDRQTMDEAIRLKTQGWRLGFEIFGDESAHAVINLVAVSRLSRKTLHTIGAQSEVH